MDLALVEKLMRMLEQSQLDMLDVTEGDLRIRLAKAGAVPEPEPAGERAADADAGTSAAMLLSGLAGTFYRAPSPGAAPFVSEGQHIEEGQVVGLVEAMKTFNPIESDRAGVVAALLAADGEPIARGGAVLRFADEA